MFSPIVLPGGAGYSGTKVIAHFSNVQVSFGLLIFTCTVLELPFEQT
jgi:hypothetical protein